MVEHQLLKHKVQRTTKICSLKYHEHQYRRAGKLKKKKKKKVNYQKQNALQSLESRERYAQQ